MTSPVPLRAYHRHSSLGDDDYTGYADSDTIAPSNSKGSPQSYQDELYNPYGPYDDTPEAQSKPWSNTAFEESVTDSIHKSSLSYDSKKLGK
jgi:hypothetical protein